MRVDNVINKIGVFSVYGFVVSIMNSTAGLHIFSALALLSFLYFYRSLAVLVKQSWAVRIIIILSGYIAIHSLYYTNLNPILERNSNPNWAHFLLIAGLPSLAIAFFLARNESHIRPVILTALIVLGVGLGLEVEWSRVLTTDFAARNLWGDRAAGETTFLAAAGLLLVLGVISRVHNIEEANLRSLAYVLLIFGGLSFLSIVVGSQTRGVWLGVGLAAIYLGLQAFKNRYGRTIVYAFFFLTLLAGAVGGLNAVDVGSLYNNRIQPVVTASQDIAENGIGALESADSPAISVRVRRWYEGFSGWAERPIFGWGGGAWPTLEERFRDGGGNKSGNFHNFYVEVLVGFGLVGLLGFLVLWLVILYHLPRALWFSSLIFFPWTLMVAVTLFFDVRIGRTDGRSLIMFMMALGIAGYLMNMWRGEGVSRTESS